MNNKTLSNILFLLVINAIVKPFWLFGIDRVVQNKLGEEAFGIYFTLFNFSMIFQILLDLGIQSYNSKAVAEENTRLNQYFANIIIAKLLLSFFFLALALLSFLVLGYSFRDFGALFILLLFNQILISFIFYLRSNLTGLHRFKLDTLFSVLDKLIMIFLAGSILYYNIWNIELSILNFIWIQTISFFINFFILLIVVGRLAFPFKYQMDIAIIKQLMIKSMPFATSIFLMAIYLKMDVIMIERLLGDKGAYEAGIYAQSFRIIDALNMIGILFANILLPSYAHRLSKKLPLISLVKQAFLFLLTIIIPITLFVLFKSNWIINSLYDNGSPYSASILSILIISFLAYNIMHIFSSLLTAAGNLKALNFVFFIGIILNLISNFFLIPKLGAKGAAITTTCSEILVLFCISFLAIRFLNTQKSVMVSNAD